MAYCATRKIANLSIWWKKNKLARSEKKCIYTYAYLCIYYAQLNLLLIFVTRAWTIIVAFLGHILKEKEPYRAMPIERHNRFVYTSLYRD